MFGQAFSVARNTFLEALRQPIYVVLLLGGTLLMALNPALSAFTFGDDQKLLLDLGLSTLFVAGIFLAAFTATGVFSREIENKTVLTVVSKPVGRPAFVLGKYLGVLGALGVASLIWSCAFLLTVRHQVLSTASDEYDEPVLVFGCGALALALGLALWMNYFHRWIFASTLTACLAPLLALAYGLVLGVNKHWELQPLATDLDPQLLAALLLILEALAILCAVAVAASTRLGQLMTLTVCFGVFMLGLSSDFLFGRHAAAHWPAAAAYALAPNFQALWLADALTQKHPVDAAYVLAASAYAGLYVLGVLGLAIGLFQTREVG